jgi:competence protein ComEA
MGWRGIEPAHLAGLLALGGLAVGLGLGLLQRDPHPVAPPSLVPGSPATPSNVEVHVAGWVVSPGVVSVPVGSLVVDVIVAAGGLRPGARVDAVNLAAPVAAGQQVLVPGPSPEGETPPGGVAPGGKVAVNRATAAELESLPGVGPVLAGRIVAYRDQNGAFSRVEDLLSVPGIGEAKLSSIRDLITVP